jgi:hypothetical protein
MAFISVPRTRVLLVFSLACALNGCSTSATPERAAREPAAKAVATDTVRREAVNRTVSVSGTLAAENEVTLS